jgi:hypothetical protein
MQRTADFHHHVANPGFPHPNGLFEHTAAFDTAVDLFEAHTPPRDLPLPCVLRPPQLRPTGLLRWVANGHTVQRERLKAQILQQLTPRWPRIRRGVGDALVMDTAGMRVTQEEEASRRVDQQQVFQHVPLVLAALASFLCSRVVGARDGSLGAVMTTRGAMGDGAARTSSVGDTSSGPDDSSTLRRARKAATLRPGASPKVRSVCRNTGRKTWIHCVALDWRIPNKRPWSSCVGFGLR